MDPNNLRIMSNKSLFPRTHLWLILPFVITISGFIFYWMSFNNSPFRHHVHGLSATAWYLLVILQPYLYQQNKMQLHRKVGFLGLFLAGALVFSGLQNIPFTNKWGANWNGQWDHIFKFSPTDWVFFLRVYGHSICQKYASAWKVACNNCFLANATSSCKNNFSSNSKSIRFCNYRKFYGGHASFAYAYTFGSYSYHDWWLQEREKSIFQLYISICGINHNVFNLYLHE